MGAQVSGKVAVVTGGASGIGEACSETLAREGAAVLITDIDDALGKDVVQRIAKMLFFSQLIFLAIFFKLFKQIRTLFFCHC